jgi:hypothetical protein
MLPPSPGVAGEGRRKLVTDPPGVAFCRPFVKIAAAMTLVWFA